MIINAETRQTRYDLAQKMVERGVIQYLLTNAASG